MNLKALQLEGELDWSQAEIVLLDAETDEATAVLTIPPTSTTGQALWPGGTGSVDVVRAVNTAVKVQRQVNPVSNRSQWKVLPMELNELPIVLPKPNPPAPTLPAPKPQPPTPPPPPKPTVKVGSELPDAFSYCPYQHYGKITTLQRTLCQDSWRQWYAKQWADDAIFERPLSIYNSAVQMGAGAIAYLQDSSRDTHLVVEGFEGLNPKLSRELLNAAASLPQDSADSTHQQAVEQAHQALTQIDSSKVISWLSMLIEAYRASRFLDEYERLLAQEPEFRDFQDKLQQFVQTVFQDQGIEAKGIIEQLVEAYVAGLLPNLLDSPVQSQAAFNTTGELWPDFLRDFEASAMVAECLLIPGFRTSTLEFLSLRNNAYGAARDQWGEHVAIQLDRAIFTIIRSMKTRNFGVGFAIPGFCGFIKDTKLKVVLDEIIKALAAGNPGGAAGKLSEILVAGFAINFGGWQFYGIDYGISTTLGNTDIDLVLYNPNLAGRAIMAFVQVKNTNDPLSQVDDIAGWINKTLLYLEEEVFRKGVFENGPFRQTVVRGMAMLVLVFHGETQDTLAMKDLAQQLKGKINNPSNIPVLMVWEDANHQVWYICISGCDGGVTRDMKAQTACAMLGYPTDCNALDADQAAPVNSTAPGNNQPAAVSPVPPPDCSSTSNVVQVCAQGIHENR